MIKKIIAMATLSAFLFFSWSCVIYRARRVVPEAANPQETDIVRVQTLSGERTEFPKDNPAWIIWGRVVAKKKGLEGTKLEKKEILKMYSDKGHVQYIETKSGVKYSADQIIKEEKEYFLVGSDAIGFSVSLKDIEFLWTREVNILATFLVDIVVPFGVFCLLIIISNPRFS